MLTFFCDAFPLNEAYNPTLLSSASTAHDSSSSYRPLSI